MLPPTCSAEKEIVWLLSTYIEKTWNDLYISGGDRLKTNEFFGYLKFKYKADQIGAQHSLDYIPGLM